MIDIHSPSAAFLSAVQLFVSETGISESELGRRAVGDGGPVRRLRAGKSITLRTADRITEYMAHERTRRAEAGARRSTACEEGAGGHYRHENQSDLALRPLARLGGWLRHMFGPAPEAPPGGHASPDAQCRYAAARRRQHKGQNP